MSIEASNYVAIMKQALEALEVANSCIDGYYLPKEKAWLPEIEQAVTSLRQAIAEAEKQEPVAVVDANDDGYWADILPDRSVKVGQLLYAHPQPKREWVGLEDEDVATVKNEFNRGALWAEKVLKEKNT